VEVAELFDTGTGLDLAGSPSQGRVEAYGQDANNPLAAALRGSPLVSEASAIVDFLLEDFDVSERAHSMLFEFGVLVLAVNREAPPLREHTDNADLDALATSGGGEFEHAAGPMSCVFRNLVAALREEPGWALGGPAALARLTNAASGYAQARRLEEFAAGALTPSLAAAARGVWKEALVEAACVACNDDSREKKDVVADAIGRLLGSVVGLASELAPFLTGEGDKRAVELVTQRFAVPAQVVKLTSPQIARALRATLELEVRDLLDALHHLDPLGGRSQLVRRLVLAMLTADGSARAVVAATTAEPPDRDDVMRRMRAIALADGEVTTDERNLLRRFDSQLHSFNDLIHRIEEDRVIDFDEFQQLREMRQTILDELFQVALADSQITDDERQLLLRAMELVPTLRSVAPTAATVA
jgi:tellurite resistance protein